ncbi:iron-sulfur cluster assembly scaffold protein [bacterium]|nr:iron-sulfur cluster assembly scaffold protein [bacterium]
MLYSKKVIQHFTHPHNWGKLKNADAETAVINPVCGDSISIYIKVSKNKKGEEIIKDIKFETLGCGAAIATSSAMTDMAKNKTLDKALKITLQDLADELEGLPPAKMHCGKLATGALRKAIKKYRDRGLGKK